MNLKLAFISVVLTGVLTVSPLMVASAEAAPKVLKLGVTLPLQIKEGLEQQRWLKLFAKLINEEGGWKIAGERYTIEWILYNDEFSAEKARTSVERLIFRDKVKHIINQWGSVAMIATLKVTEPNNILVIGTCVSDEPCKPEYKYVFKGADPNPVGVCLSVASAKEYLKRGAKAFVIVNPDDAGGRARTEQDKRTVPSSGLKFMDTLLFQRGTVDFGPLATKIKALNPDVINFSSTAGEDITKIVVALHDAGYKGIIESTNLHTAVINDIVAKIGPEYLEGSICPLNDPRQYQKDPEIVKYITAYEKEYGEWNIEGCMWVGNWFTFKGAVEATQSLDVEVLTNYLSKGPAPVKALCGWRAPIARPDLGNLRTIAAANSLWEGIMKGGKMVPFFPIGSEQIYKAYIEAYGWKDIYEKYWKEHGYPKFPD
jgi:ABC-type branched-subunit amino acid transport system substrate-binding protein